MTVEPRSNVGKEEPTSASGAKALTFRFKALMTLLGLISGSVCRGAFRLLNGHCRLEVGHLGRQQTDLRSILCPLFRKPLLGQVNPSNGIDQALAEPHLRLIRGRQFLSQVPHFRLYIDQAITIRSTLSLCPES
jgi:hypothetical protein